MNQPARFAAVAAHPGYPAAMTFAAPPPSSWYLELAVAILAMPLVLGMLVGLGGVLTARLVVVAAIVMIGALAVIALGAMARLQAPAEPLVAVVIDERVELGVAHPHRRWHHGFHRHHVHTTATYWATIVLADGTRRRLRTDEHIASQITTGDIGVAYAKGGHLVAFRRFPV